QSSKVWFTRGFDVVSTIENAHLNPDTLIEGHKYSEFMSAALPAQRPNASVVFLTTESLIGGQPRPLISNYYPFGNIRIPAGQLFYYCKDAIHTG
ncbi:hypothetical protein ACS22W_25590, partial [Escherichia coli]|uniref:hypothetical protein n=1 Tax=Escherichia coli TaxID=562 RepID=UPI003F268293